MKYYQVFDNLEVRRGGWYEGKWLTLKEIQSARTRWLEKSYKTGLESGHYIPHQCGGCKYFGAINADYGLCFNQDSPQDGLICFEHGGCLKHSDYEVKK